jgi:uncharacterized protein YjbI with pentapeptide repeats
LADRILAPIKIKFGEVISPRERHKWEGASQVESRSRWIILVAAAWLTWQPAQAQDMMRHVDLSSPRFSTAEMARAEVEASLRAAHGAGADFSGKSLNGLDHSGLDFLQRQFPRRADEQSEFVGVKT